MNPATRSRNGKVIAMLGLVVLSGTSQALIQQETEGRIMGEGIQSMAMKTVCLGRFLLDVPANAEISFGPMTLAGWHISSIADETDDQFSTRLQARELALKAAKNEKGWKSLETVIDASHEDITAKIFVYDRKWSYGFDMGKRVESESAAIHALARTKSISFDFKAEYLDTEYAMRLAQLIKQLKQRGDEEVPTEPGFCFGRGLIRDPLSASDNESSVMFIGLQGHPDVAIALHSSAGLEPGDTLLQREARNNVKRNYSSHFHSLRKGKRTLNGIPGEEVLDRVSELNGSTLHGLMWESLSKKDDVLLPDLSLEMATGKGRPGEPVNSSFSDAAVLALWDKISSSLRVRPVTAPTAAAANVPLHAK